MNFRYVVIAAVLSATCLMAFAASTVRFGAASYRVTENVGEVLLSIVRLDDLGTVVKVDYRTADVTAKAGEDYTAATGTVTFDAGQTNQTVRIAILNDGLREVPALESFSVTLTNASPNAALGVPAGATIVVGDNDPGIEVEFAQYRAREDTPLVVVAVVRGSDVNMSATVDYTTVAQTSAAGSDFTQINGTFTFTATEKLKLITIPILNDGLKESDETFRLVLTNAIGDVFGARTSATITITDNDPGVEFEVNQVWVHEDQGGVRLNVLRGNDQLSEPFAVSYTVTNLTATSGNDHGATNATLEFAAGELRKAIWIPVLNDQALESDENLQIQLSNPSSGAALGRSANLTCTVTICDASGLDLRRIQGIHALASGSIQLDLAGGVSKRFGQYYSIFPLESSFDLLQWQPLGLLGYLNGSTNPPTFFHTQAVGESKCFYRVASSFLITPSRPPTGPHSVGKFSRLLTDSSRRNRYQNSTNGSFMMSVWYPAIPKTAELPASYDDEKVAQDGGWQSPFMDRAPRFSCSSFAEAKVDLQSGGYPVVLYSHGNGAIRVDNQELAENLATHGYVVASVDHWDASLTAFPDGTLYRKTDVSQTISGLQDRVSDLNFLVDELNRMNQTDPILTGSLDLGRLAAMGWSWGALTAGEFSRVDIRCRVAITLDWAGDEGTVPDLVRWGLQKPVLMLNRSDNNRQTLFDKAIQDAYWMQISDTVHGEFSTYGWFDKPTSLPQTREAARTIHAHVLSFLNKYLKGQDDHLLDGSSREYPRVIGFKRK